jgi:hypothetical protein
VGCSEKQCGTPVSRIYIELDTATAIIMSSNKERLLMQYGKSVVMETLVMQKGHVVDTETQVLK